MGVNELVPRICEYALAYVESARATVEKYSSVADSVPAFLKGHRRVEIHAGTDGAVVAYYEANENSTDVTLYDMMTIEIAHQVSGGVLDLGRSKPIGLSVGRMEVRKAAEEEGGEDELVWKSPFEQVQIDSYRGWRRKTAEVGRLDGQDQVLQYITAHLLGLEDLNLRTAPSEVVNALESAIEQFVTLLDSEPLEEDLQKFLTKNPVLLHPFAASVEPKVKLGTEYVTDFVIEVVDHEYVLVEIERSVHRLFTKAGSATSALRHAQTQVEDWQRWIRDHIAYAREKLPGMNQPKGWVIIGRS